MWSEDKANSCMDSSVVPRPHPDFILQPWNLGGAWGRGYMDRTHRECCYGKRTHLPHCSVSSWCLHRSGMVAVSSDKDSVCKLHSACVHSYTARFHSCFQDWKWDYVYLHWETPALECTSQTARLLWRTLVLQSREYMKFAWKTSHATSSRRSF